MIANTNALHKGTKRNGGEYAYNAAKEKDSRNSQPSIGDEE